MFKKVLLLFAFVGVCSLSASAQAVIKFEKTIVDLGTFTEDQRQTCVFIRLLRHVDARCRNIQRNPYSQGRRASFASLTMVRENARVSSRSPSPYVPTPRTASLGYTSAAI